MAVEGIQRQSGLTNDQKRRLASTLIQAAGDLVYGTEVPASIPKDIPRYLAAEQLARWLCRLPGSDWDHALPEVPGEPRTRIGRTG
jgi:hypothetical protein